MLSVVLWKVSCLHFDLIFALYLDLHMMGFEIPLKEHNSFALALETLPQRIFVPADIQCYKIHLVLVIHSAVE